MVGQPEREKLRITIWDHKVKDNVNVEMEIKRSSCA